MAYAFRRPHKGEARFTGMYLGPDGRWRSAGTFPSKRAAERAAQREEQLVEEGRWHDRTLGTTTFASYVEETWFPSKHLEASTRAGYRSNLDRHFLPYFGRWPMARILPSLVQGWVTKVAAEGLSPRSIDLDQPLPVHRVTEGHCAAKPDPDARRVRPAFVGPARGVRPLGDHGHRDGHALG